MNETELTPSEARHRAFRLLVQASLLTGLIGTGLTLYLGAYAMTPIFVVGILWFVWASRKDPFRRLYHGENA